jgi:DNA-binding NarL/FixJ family response regulator
LFARTAQVVTEWNQSTFLAAVTEVQSGFVTKETVMKYNRVILADSHQNMLEGLRGLLETMFEAVVMVADKNSLFDAAEKLEPDLAVVDLSLPSTGEINIVSTIRRRFPDLKIIILSVHDEPTVVNEVMAAGAAGFVLKRSAAFDLIRAVEVALQGGTYVSPSLELKPEDVG